MVFNMRKREPLQARSRIGRGVCFNTKKRKHSLLLRREMSHYAMVEGVLGNIGGKRTAAVHRKKETQRKSKNRRESSNDAPTTEERSYQTGRYETKFKTGERGLRGLGEGATRHPKSLLGSEKNSWNGETKRHGEGYVRPIGANPLINTKISQQRRELLA